MQISCKNLPAWAAALVVVGSLCANAQVLQNCPSTNLCFEVNVPDSTAQSGSGDIYLRISAPTSYSWAALGQGSQMRGTNMFVVYTSADGGNVTISQRSASRHNMPTEVSQSTVMVLEGSGVQGNTMTANIRCTGCTSWSGGTMNPTDSASNWIYAYKEGSALATNDAATSIQQHDEHGSLQLDLTQATGGSSQNPFLAAQTSNATNTSGTSGTTTTTQSGGGGGGGGGESSSSSNNSQNIILLVHASLAGIAFVALFPGGAILIRLANLKSVIWIHAAMQALAYIVFVAAAALGIYLAVNQGNFSRTGIDIAHPIIGLVLLGLFFFQPLGGWLHHRQFIKKGRRTAVSYVHIFTGRVGIALGMVNGALGFWVVGGRRTGAKIAYIVIVAVVYSGYIAVITMGERRRKKQSAES
ncbi:hypothetical protein LTR78_001631 [Recurvomyces mirabilis]|uniref:Cytochrome b561 domain-containing protein n=1 Tax=Recurvomyces mirabilis TaxID=574656 RepID=A0AAE1C538_9PEZI|nr:hypothetical protein LTR78_001631 [Recurvomyces mirabilis]KAK5151799.1 hypothetical protein LTS14_008931 [Recurvomyces mirabilis]